MSEPQSIILFHASAHAIRAEKTLHRENVACKLIPVPRHLSSDCGVCLRLARRDAETARVTLEAAGVEIVMVHDA